MKAWLVTKLLSLSKLVSGPVSWLVQHVFAYVLKLVWDSLKSWYEAQELKRKRREQAEEALKKYEEAIKQDLSREERKKRAEDVLNSIDE